MDFFKGLCTSFEMLGRKQSTHGKLCRSQCVRNFCSQGTNALCKRRPYSLMLSHAVVYLCKAEASPESLMTTSDTYITCSMRTAHHTAWCCLLTFVTEGDDKKKISPLIALLNEA